MAISYQICYIRENRPGKNSKKVPLRTAVLTAGAMLVFAVLVECFWPRGWEVLHGMLYPVRDSGRQALEVFGQELRQGVSIKDAVGNLYETVLAENGFASVR